MRAEGARRQRQHSHNACNAEKPPRLGMTNVEEQPHDWLDKVGGFDWFSGSALGELHWTRRSNLRCNYFPVMVCIG